MTNPVLSVNYIAPDAEGNVSIPIIEGPMGPVGPRGQTGATGIPGAQGFPGPMGPRGYQGEEGRDGRDAAVVIGESRQLKFFIHTATVGQDGNFTVDYTDANFTEVASVQLTVESIPGSSQGSLPLSANIVSKSLTSLQGKAYKVSSAGALVAMQQIFADAGTLVHVVVYGY